MTDIQKLKKLLNEFNIKYAEYCNQEPPSTIVGSITEYTISINHGKGYEGFFTDFLFTKEGKFMYHSNLE